MSEEQRLVWLDLEQSSNPCIYNETCTLHCLGIYDHGVMTRSLHALLLRHEVLRTTFSASAGADPVQRIHADAEVAFPFHDLSDLPADERSAEAGRIAAVDAETPFGLSDVPLFRARAFRIGEGDHRLYLTIHHLLFDGDSLQRVLMPELVELYEAALEGRDPDLKPLPLQYGDYAAWQASEPARSRHGGQLAYWQGRLAGELPVIDLPADRPRPTRRSGAGAVETVVVPADLLARLREAGRAAGVSLYMVVLASYATVLHRWSGQDDLTIGGIVSTLRRPELRRTAGLFLNTVVLRLAPSADLSFRSLLIQVRDCVLEAMEHSEVPFGLVARSLSGGGRGGRDGLFQAALSMQPPPPPLRSGWRLTAIDVPVTTTKFDLYLEVEERDRELDARLIYSTDLFDTDTVRRMIGHWQRLLRAMAEDVDGTIGGVVLLAPDEEEAVLRASLGPVEPMGEATLHERIARTIAASPDAVAVVHGDTRWSYAELDARANGLAQALVQRGVRAGDIVGLLVERSKEMVAAILAILRTGAAYLPLDPSFPSARLAEIEADAMPRLIVTQRSLLGKVQGAPVLLEDVPASAEAFEAVAGHPDDLAYIIYTSGSTGVPKGVEIAHRGVVNVMEALAQDPGFGPGDRLLAVSRLTFDMSVPDLFLPLMRGGTLVVADEGAVTDPDLLRRLIEAHDCSFMQATPATWRSMFASGWKGHAGLRILCGGEALPRDLADRILACGMRLWNGYGPTEATIYTTIAPVPVEGGITIGRPIRNLQAVVLDDRGGPVPFNVPGELHIGGVGLARGYRDAELDRRSFVRLPALGGNRFYRSGDVARTRTDGRIEWLGRRDGQIKIRGFRIDLGDVEAALLRHPDVAASVANSFRASSGLNELAAYLVAHPGRSIDPAELRDFLLGLLPAYMVPTRYVPLTALPTTSSGKVDRRALPPPGDCHMVATGEPGAFADEHERRLAAIWADVLGVDAVGPQDDFFDLGGHSLLAARMFGRVAEEFGRRLPMSALYEAATVRRLAALLRSEGAEPVPSRLLTVQAGADLRPLFWIDAVPNFRQALFRPLARALGAERPVIGLSIDLERHRDLQGADLATVARDMAGSMLASGAQPPFLIGGYCNGGACALAVADLLRREGKEVAVVIMVDASNQAQTRSRLGRWRRDVLHIRRLKGAARGAFLREILSDRFARVRRRLFGVRDDVDRHLEVNDRMNRMDRAFDPSPYPGRVVLFRTEEYDGASVAGWSAAIPDALEVHPVRGGHVTVLHRPAVEELGSAIAELLAELERPDGTKVLPIRPEVVAQ
ncbi:non-ribosomal peptide synthetase [Sphingomonas desiccabilis]|nr:non-ribosomal peptide synthetase [Sphingomonas desiccabilis]MBB3912331.1 amino acid adenylation domain-containing protein [Sphingomonas desiccabilis]